MLTDEEQAKMREEKNDALSAQREKVHVPPAFVMATPLGVVLNVRVSVWQDLESIRNFNIGWSFFPPPHDLCRSLWC